MPSGVMANMNTTLADKAVGKQAAAQQAQPHAPAERCRRPGRERDGAMNLPMDVSTAWCAARACCFVT